jgi:hypothetical protein
MRYTVKNGSYVSNMKFDPEIFIRQSDIDRINEWHAECRRSCVTFYAQNLV